MTLSSSHCALSHCQRAALLEERQLPSDSVFSSHDSLSTVSLWEAECVSRVSDTESGRKRKKIESWATLQRSRPRNIPAERREKESASANTADSWALRLVGSCDSPCWREWGCFFLWGIIDRPKQLKAPLNRGVWGSRYQNQWENTILIHSRKQY